MQFSTLYAEVGQQLGIDITDTTSLSESKRWINIIQQDVVGRWPWQFLKSRELIQTVLDKTSGTVSITSGATAVVGVSTSFASTDVGSFIQFSSALDWYKITAVTDTTHLTLEAVYAQTSNLSGGTYTIRKFFYSLSSNADAIIDIRSWNIPLQLIETDVFTLDERRPNPQSSGTSTSFIVYGFDSSGNIQITPYPFPSDQRNLEIRTLKRVSDLSADADLSVIPAKWHHVLIYGAVWMGSLWMKKFDQAQVWNGLYEGKIKEMQMKERSSEDILNVLTPVDSYEFSRWLRFPDQYPVLR